MLFRSPHTPRNINMKSPLFELSLKGIKLHHYRLTYDNKSTVHIKDLLLSDHARLPVFHIEFRKKISKLIENSNDTFTKLEGSQKRGNFKNPNKRASVRFPVSGSTSLTSSSVFQVIDFFFSYYFFRILRYFDVYAHSCSHFELTNQYIY